MRARHTSFLAAAISAIVLQFTPALALDKPAGDVVLTVTGAIKDTNAENAAEFDIAMLEKLSGRAATLETPWTQGKVTFSGPFMAELMNTVGAHGKILRVTALNDYTVEVPLSDATDIKTILATRMNDEPMSVRDKGPLFLIYPFDLDPSLYNEKYFARSVWQIKSIEVIE
ncbi:molybdopterin-dependent oxidoreductase [Rhizobium sp. G21]|uniref:molybdopterin-dependent oxidoreductase n=1 Tax=Rhizobium sp. G21 TaxID=2758439 RepID=UPI0016041677|nr:molybdopterin-dependent oxidoreductase [Rhizobium sp. G21]MBB1247423.1 molybdopterin-dependent oxidoreductase [Rhizobium sp. G21]